MLKSVSNEGKNNYSHKIFLEKVSCELPKFLY